MHGNGVRKRGVAVFRKKLRQQQRLFRPAGGAEQADPAGPFRRGISQPFQSADRAFKRDVIDIPVIGIGTDAVVPVRQGYKPMHGEHGAGQIIPSSECAFTAMQANHAADRRMIRRPIDRAARR